MYSLLRPVLFCLNAETSHNLVVNILARFSKHQMICDFVSTQVAKKVKPLPVNVMGLDFPNPVGLAPGLDKQGNCANIMSALGFGWVEMGTVTPLPQPGNPKPRMFRLTDHHAIINRMGFNSCGLEAFLRHTASTNPGIIKGINIGKNFATPVQRAADDYLECLDAVYAQSDYVAINISSPNTSDLRTLQDDKALDQLLSAICNKRLQLADQHGSLKPLVIKISPDLEHNQVNTIANLARTHKVDGIAATNTTTTRDSVAGHPLQQETGGLSGAPVRHLSNQVVAKLRQNLQGEIPIIGVGGIDSLAAAEEKFAAGADLIQLYTGFIYQGPTLIREIVNGLWQHSKEQGFSEYLCGMRGQIS